MNGDPPLNPPEWDMVAELDHVKAENARLRKALETAHKDLIAASAFYERWYDEGISNEAGNVAYDLRCIAVGVAKDCLSAAALEGAK